MRNVNVTFPAEYAGKTLDEKLALVEKELDGFSTYMASLPNPWFKGNLVPQERALLKSYLVWKLSGKDPT